MGIRLEVHYNINQGDFPLIVRAIKKHLAPKNEKPRRRTLIFSEHIDKQLVEKPDHSQPFIVQAGLVPRLGASLARDLAMFREIKDPADEESFYEERYFVPSPGGLGMTNAFTLDIFGKHVVGYGQYPMTIRMDGDFGEMDTESYLLGIAKESIAKRGMNGLLEWKNESRKISRNIDPNSRYGLEDHVLGMGLTEAEIQKQIDQLNLQRTTLGMTQLTSAIRFYWDFFGFPIHGQGHQYKVMNAQSATINWGVTPEHLAGIVKYPTQPAEELARKIYENIACAGKGQKNA